MPKNGTNLRPVFLGFQPFRQQWTKNLYQVWLTKSFTTDIPKSSLLESLPATGWGNTQKRNQEKFSTKTKRPLVLASSIHPLSLPLRRWAWGNLSIHSICIVFLLYLWACGKLSVNSSSPEHCSVAPMEPGVGYQ